MSNSEREELLRRLGIAAERMSLPMLRQTVKQVEDNAEWDECITKAYELAQQSMLSRRRRSLDTMVNFSEHWVPFTRAIGLGPQQRVARLWTTLLKAAISLPRDSESQALECSMRAAYAAVKRAGLTNSNRLLFHLWLYCLGAEGVELPDRGN